MQATRATKNIATHDRPHTLVTCAGAYEALASAKSDEALQNDLFELIGFDHFDLIQRLLLRRDDIVAATVASLGELAAAAAAGPSSSSPKVVRREVKRGPAASLQSTFVQNENQLQQILISFLSFFLAMF